MAALAIVLSSPARAQAGVQPEENRIADILQSALVAHGAEVNRCFERALADTLDVSGKIELSVDVGAAGKITKAEPALDEVKSPVLLACLEASALTWSLVGIDPGSTVVVPLAFEGQAAQFTIKVADAPDHGPPAPKHKAGGSPPPAPPFSVKLLVDEATMHAQKAAVAQLTVAPANRIALHRHPGGGASLRGARPRARAGRGRRGPREAGRGDGDLHSRLRCRTRSRTWGARRRRCCWRSSCRPAPRRSTETRRIRPAARPSRSFMTRRWRHQKASSSSSPRRPPRRPCRCSAARGRRRRCSTWPTPAIAPSTSVSWRSNPASRFRAHSHAGAEEIIFVTAGAGELTVGSEKFPFEAPEALYIPAGQPHAVKFTGTDKAELVQIYAPAGPEDRYKDAKTKP